MKLRPVTNIIQSHHQREGGGFLVRRPFPTAGLDVLDPFLLLDEMGPVTYRPNEAIGAPDHPHRGFETVTYVLEGGVQHKDSAGNSGRIGPGDVQWMTAGKGVIHSEMPTDELLVQGGRMHGFQLWVNLPRSHKMMAPRYQGLLATQIPRAQSNDGLCRVVVLAGQALGVVASIDTITPIIYQHWILHPGATVTHPVPEDFNLGVYVFEGTIESDKKPIGEGAFALYGQGDAIVLSIPEKSTSPAQLLLLGGRPIQEPIARYGPFVMNTRAELLQAFQDFRSGRF